MKICFLSVEIFAWGKYGGFGKATRIICRELVKRGIEVYAVVPRQKNQKPVELLDGIKVLSFPKHLPWKSIDLIKGTGADIFHSAEPSTATYFAFKYMPKSKHIITFRDPRDFKDWILEFELPSINKLQVLLNYIYESNFLVTSAIKKIENLYCSSNFLIEKVMRMYSLKTIPVFLPTPVKIKKNIKKSSKPTVCFLARLDRRKRPELFFELARKYQDVSFIAVGSSRDRMWDQYLRNKYSNLPNLEMRGFIDQFSNNEHSEILEKSWIMVNTATREALPNSYLEAAAHKCAVLTGINTDDFASKYGYHVVKDNFSEGLEYLISDNNWRVRGEIGYDYVKKNFELGDAINKHISIYKSLLNTA